MKSIATILIFSVSTLLFSSCSNSKDFVFNKIESWKLDGLGIGQSSISARLQFYNPNKFGLTVKNLRSNVAVEGNDIGTCNSDTTLKIKGFQTFTLPVKIQFKNAAALMGGLNYFAKDSILVKMNGTMRVGRSMIFINYKFDNLSKVSTKF